MKRLSFSLLLTPALLWAGGFATLLKEADANLLLQAKQQELHAKEALYRAARAHTYPRIDASLQALYLKDRPTMLLHLPIPGVPSRFQVGEQQNYIGALTLSYPIFTGFALSSMIDKARFDAQRAALQLQDTRRNLYLKIAALYGQGYALDAAIHAQQEALKAIGTSYKKAHGFYKAGLIAPSELENIKARKYATRAALQRLQAQRKEIVNTLAYLSGERSAAIGPLPRLDLPSKTELIRTALHDREDLKALQKALQMDEADITLARSERYPTLALVGALKTQGETIKLNGDGYTNPNKSYVGLAAKWRLFDGFESASRIEAAKAKRLARLLYLQDYRRRIRTDLTSAYETLQALRSEQEAKTAQLAAQRSYYTLTRGRFENHLAGADELSRAIAARAAAQAQLEAVQARLFVQKCTLLLQTSLSSFQKSLADMQR